MYDLLDQRACDLAVYMIENNATIRETAKHFGISKSTVHKDLSERLPHCNRALSDAVRQVLTVNLRERHLRGGMATKNKYLRLRLSGNAGH